MVRHVDYVAPDKESLIRTLEALAKDLKSHNLPLEKGTINVTVYHNSEETKAYEAHGIPRSTVLGIKTTIEIMIGTDQYD